MLVHILPKGKSGKTIDYLMWNLSEILKESCFYKCVGCIILTCPYLNHITKSAKLLNNTDTLCERKKKGVRPTVNSTEWNSPTVSSNWMENSSRHPTQRTNSSPSMPGASLSWFSPVELEHALPSPVMSCVYAHVCMGVRMCVWSVAGSGTPWHYLDCVLLHIQKVYPTSMINSCHKSRSKRNHSPVVLFGNYETPSWAAFI